ncbi:hypothetical protein [Escherichia coli]|uniref:hypothetical protein n=1 Tax=Escherichia coli TaxID=562 RepID=UPI001FCE9D33|nr:hypothetical protein [Escherichia coli]
MSLGFLEQARNESMARRELSIQSHALLVVRTLDSIYSALQRNPFDGVELDALAAIMYLFDAMLYYADRERQPGMTRKEAELCLVGYANLIKFRLAGHWSFMAQVTKFPVRRSACHNFLRPNR